MPPDPNATTFPSDRGGATPPSKRTWLDQRHRDFALSIEDWLFTRAHYEASVVQPEQVKNFLVQKNKGETDESFKERCRLADYTNHFATVIDSIAGMLFHVEEKANRVFEDPDNEENTLGDVSDPTSPIGRLWQNADGEVSYRTLWKQLASDLILYSNPLAPAAWVVVGGVDDVSTIKILPPWQVPNWRYGKDGQLEQVLVEADVDTRSDLRVVYDGDGTAKQWLLYELSGWSQWSKTNDGEPHQEDEGTYRYENPQRLPALPIFPVRIPIRRAVGWYLSVKQNRIFNKESERDHLLRLGCMPRLVLGGSTTDFQNTTDDLAKGGNVIHEPAGKEGTSGTSRYVSPEMAAAIEQRETLKQKVEEFYVTGFREYGDAARERTAEEVRQDAGSGIGAFLQLLDAALDNAENGAAWRFAQREFPTERRKWFVSRIERSNEYLPKDPDATIDAVAKRAIGDATTPPLPMGIDAQVSAVKEIVDYMGAPVNELQIRAAVKAKNAADAMTAHPDLPWPAQAKVDVLVNLLAASGYVDVEAALKDEEGEAAKLLKELKEKALELAQAQEVAKRREAETFGTGGPAPTDNPDDAEDPPQDKAA